MAPLILLFGDKSMTIATTINIKLNKANKEKKSVFIRSMSDEHWRAFTKLAAANNMTHANYLAALIEKELGRGKNTRK